MNKTQRRFVGSIALLAMAGFSIGISAVFKYPDQPNIPMLAVVGLAMMTPLIVCGIAVMLIELIRWMRTGE